MYNNEITLYKKVLVGKDKLGQPIYDKVKRTILCTEASIGFNEFYRASTTDFRPEIKVIIHRFEYDNEEYCYYKEIPYRIIRTYFHNGTTRQYNLDPDELELTLERVIGHE